MDADKIKTVIDIFTQEAKTLYDDKLKHVILYGSCARGDFKSDSDIDILVLLNVSKEKLPEERKLLFSMTDSLDLEYDVVLAPVLQSYDIYQKYLSVSYFYQTIEKEGVWLA